MAMLLLSSASAQAQVKVQVPVMRGETPAVGATASSDPPLMLPGYWFAAGRPDAGPAVLLLHGCGGPYGAGGDLSRRMRDYAALLNAQGWHALVLDSLSPRGETELCTQKVGTRAVTQTDRRRDALAGLRWLAAQPEVDAGRLVLLGWSNGGSTVLAASNLNQAEVASAAVLPRAAVAFYPGCEVELRRGYRAAAPLLLLLGGADDWTPAAPCQTLAAADPAGAPRPRLRVFPGAYHGFDGRAALRLRSDVPNGVRPGAGVHVGAQPEAREASQQAMLEFLREALQ